MQNFSTRPVLIILRWTSLTSSVGTALITMLVLAVAQGADGPANEKKPLTVEEQLPSLHLLSGPWNEGTVYRESLFFVKPDEGKPAARLLFDADKVLAIHRADSKQTFEAGKDYQLSDDGSGLVVLDGSRIPYRKESELYLPKGSPNSIGHRTGKPDTSLLFGEGHFFHDQQVETDEQLKLNKALKDATRKADLAIMKDLLMKGADPNWQDPDDNGKTALIRAIFTHKVEVARLLLDNGADIHVPATSGQKRYAVLYAGVIGTVEMAEFILSKGGDKDVNKEPGMLGSLCAHGDAPAKMITLMVKSGADPDVLYEKAVPLVAAIKKGRPDYVKALIEAKADVNWKDKTRKSILQYAVEKEDKEIITLLKDAGAKE